MDNFNNKDNLFNTSILCSSSNEQVKSSLFMKHDIFMFAFRNILFLLTGVLVFLAFLVMGIFTYLSFSMVLLPDLLLRVNFIPMLCVILAYVGYGLGYNIVPGILAAELTPVEIR